MVKIISPYVLLVLLTISPVFVLADTTTCVDSNCALCPNSNDNVCTQCKSKYYLYDNAADQSVTCINCDTSCTACNPGPTCFACADSIEEENAACRVDSIGFQISFTSPNQLILDFAHPLAKAATLTSISAKDVGNNDLPTTGWNRVTCAANAKTCTITTDNVTESKLPLTLDFEFTKA